METPPPDDEIIGWPDDEPVICPSCFRAAGHYPWCRKKFPEG